jgi:tyrosyl-tRNA synthetase
MTWQAALMADLAEDLRFRGLIHQLTDPELEPRLDSDRLTVYSGIDPTADSLHVGHLLQVCTLRRLQLAGHRPIALAGGGTGFVGDPGGKSEERSLLSHEELQANLAGIRGQLERLLDFGDSGDDAAPGALLVNNADWLEPLSLFEFLRDVGKHFTVNQMIAKESVKSRIERPDQGISFTEFSYMLLQAYDYLYLCDSHGCRLQLGGSDQWGNITMGLELIRKVRGAEAFALTWPLLLRADGTKYGKSESEAIWLDPSRTSPYELYQYFLRKPDDEVGRLLRFFTFLSHEDIAALDVEVAARPERREAQTALARAVGVLVHGEAETDRAEAASQALFSEDVAKLDEATLLEVFADAPSSTLPRALLDGEGLELVDVLVSTGLVASKTAARTSLAQGGAYVNNRRRRDREARLTRDDLLHDRYVVLRRGRRDYHLLCFG